MSTQDQPTEPLGASAGAAPENEGQHVPQQAGEPVLVAEPTRKRRWPRVLVWTVGAIVVLVGLFFVADAVLRQVAQNTVSDEIQKQLPPDVTAKDLTVTIHGFSVIAQLAAGRFDEVDLRSSDVRVQGNRLSAAIVAHGVPTDTGKPVRRIDGSMTIGQDSLNNLIDLPDGTTATLNHNAVGLKGTGTILGIDVGYTASVTPTLKNGDTVVLTPRNVSVTAAGGALDVTRFAKDLLPSTIPICVAQYLPKGVEVTGLKVSEGSAHVSVGADDLVLDEESLDAKGSCG